MLFFYVKGIKKMCQMTENSKKIHIFKCPLKIC